MLLVAGPRWSFGRNQILLREFEAELARSDVSIHVLRSDVDQNRTLSVYSSPDPERVFAATLRLAALAFDSIDMTRHMGSHPRTGALDECPFMALGEGREADLLVAVRAFAEELSDQHGVPIFYEEKSNQGRGEAHLSQLRDRGFGGLFLSMVEPDVGPKEPHPTLGIAMVGLRGYSIEFAVAAKSENVRAAQSICREISRRRAEGDPAFLGASALAVQLPTALRVEIQVALQLPELVPVDPLVKWICDAMLDHGLGRGEARLVSVIRESDLPMATRLRMEREQVVKEEDAV